MRSPLFYFLCPLPASPASFTVSSAGTHLQRISTTRVISIDNLTSNIGNIIHMSHWSRRTTMLLTSGIAAVSVALAAPAIALLPGSDVASHQHPGSMAIDWARVKAAGQQFAIVKATEGLSYVNPHYQEDSTSMRAAGLIRGTYHYALPQYSAILQTQHYAAVLATNTTSLDLPPALDLEETGGLSPAALQIWVRAFLTTLDKLTGRQTIIYVSPGFWRYQMGNTTEFSERPLWIADSNGGTSPTMPLPGGWTKWTFWQYTGNGSVDGVATPIDLNTFNGSKQELLALTRLGASQKTILSDGIDPDALPPLPELPAIDKNDIPDIRAFIPPDVQRKIERDARKQLRNAIPKSVPTKIPANVSKKVPTNVPKNVPKNFPKGVPAPRH